MSQNNEKKDSTILSTDGDVTSDPDPFDEPDFSTASTTRDSIEPPFKKCKYSDSKWKQQTTHAYKPLHIWHILLTFGILLLAIGLFQIFATEEYVFVIHDYTDCKAKGSDMTCSDMIKNSSISSSSCPCEDQIINIPRDMSGRVTVSYELLNFHQHQRHYLTSRDNDQLLGRLYQNGKVKKPSEDCEPFDYVGDRVVYPCGNIANSFFTDKITLRNHKDEDIMFEKTLAWSSDKHVKFAKPNVDYKHENFSKAFVKPPAWSEDVWDEFWADGGVTGDDFIHWMRTAAFDKFRNPYATFDGSVSTCDKNFKGLCKGTYKLSIVYRFKTVEFKGRKRVVISNNAFLSDENRFLVITHIAVGSICVILGLVTCLFSNVSVSKVQPYYFEVDYEDAEAENLPEDENNPPVGNITSPPPQVQHEEVVRVVVSVVVESKPEVLPQPTESSPPKTKPRVRVGSTESSKS